MFTRETVSFLKDLQASNSKDWFAANKARYVTHVKDAATQFCDDLAPRLAARYDTKATSKVFRIHRDLRFSRDKTPYNAHVHISFTDTATGAAWMFGLQPDTLTIGYGVFAFDKSKLTQWRDRVAGPDGDKLSILLNPANNGGLRLSEPELKRVPSPHPTDHANADLLRRKGLALWHDGLPLDRAFGVDAPAAIGDAMQVFDPVRNWMVRVLPT
ncbi:TIGR02453 family protein [Aliiroseovarius sp. S1339]|uniref:TIGR02453 family protein n=1 Tax=Aliiroseovarius sp. S1339 TaxID=2936990 RepID=UPI0020C1771A|nr:TIGR02453 family protein [Aliiroseovarius sp. S1339]MCK8464242.1 TIGR02453 family protein [Aliiroseovarius sp. S1339]